MLLWAILRMLHEWECLIGAAAAKESRRSGADLRVSLGLDAREISLVRIELTAN